LDQESRMSIRYSIRTADVRARIDIRHGGSVFIDARKNEALSL
jgi:hypothetical protein